MRRILTAAALVVLLAGCSNATGTAKNAPARPTPSAPTTSASPTPGSASPSASAASPSSGARAGSNITLSGQGRYLPPGPFKITPVKCGPYTQAEKTKLGTNANGGLIFTYTNQGNTLTSGVVLTVNFLNGTNVAGSNVNGAPVQIGHGQTATAAVDALGGGGSDLTFSSCEIMQYMLPQGGATFAP